MENFLLLIVCFLLGIGLRIGGVIDEKGPAAINAVIIHMSLPALAILYAHDLPLGPELILPAAMAWIVFRPRLPALFPFARAHVGHGPQDAGLPGSDPPGWATPLLWGYP